MHLNVDGLLIKRRWTTS